MTRNNTFWVTKTVHMAQLFNDTHAKILQKLVQAMSQLPLQVN